MDHPSDRARRAEGMAVQLARMLGLRWSKCRGCHWGVVQGYGTDETCEACSGAGFVLEPDPDHRPAKRVSKTVVVPLHAVADRELLSDATDALGADEARELFEGLDRVEGGSQS